MRYRLLGTALVSLLLLTTNEGALAQKTVSPTKQAAQSTTTIPSVASAAVNTEVNSAPVQLAANMSKAPFGIDSYKEPVELYTIQNAHGMVAKIMTFGATLTQLLVPDGNGGTVDVVLGCDNEKAYEDYTAFIGCILGRVAGRITDANFTLNGKNYFLKPNSGPNTLHGGVRGFDKRMWKAQPIIDAKAPAIKFTYFDKNDRQGFPGNLNVSVTYTLTDDNSLKLDYVATTDMPTPVNLSSHFYFNLAGAGHGNILQHNLQINADSYLPIDPLQLPTGVIAPVAGTAFDFTQSKAMGRDLTQVIGGYNHFFVKRPSQSQPSLVATVSEPISGRVMEMYTTDPGIQFSTGNQLGSSPKAGIGGSYAQFSGFLLYDEGYPDAVHHTNFPSIILNPKETYKKTTIYKFSQGTPQPQAAPQQPQQQRQ